MTMERRRGERELTQSAESLLSERNGTGVKRKERRNGGKMQLSEILQEREREKEEREGGGKKEVKKNGKEGRGQRGSVERNEASIPLLQ